MLACWCLLFGSSYRGFGFLVEEELQVNFFFFLAGNLCIMDHRSLMDFYEYIIYHSEKRYVKNITVIFNLLRSGQQELNNISQITMIIKIGFNFDIQ